MARRPAGYFASPLRYPGGKGRLGPWLATVIEKNGLKGGWYVEPYAGGAGAGLYLLLQGYADQIVINDADPLIYSFWQSVVYETDAFIERILRTPATLETRAQCQAIVADTENSFTALDLGFAAFFLNRTSRSGILAGGVIGGKTQQGAYKLDARYERSDLVERVRQIGALRERITVVGMDALDLLTDSSLGLPKRTLIYMDPPYYVKGSQLYLHHYKHQDHQDIAQCAKALSHPLLITYDNCPEVRRLYRGMKATEFSLQYSTHVARPRAREVLFYANLTLPSAPELTRGRSLISGRRSAVDPTGPSRRRVRSLSTVQGGAI